ncbi:MAG: nickel pincer cofactor biosynthesis protein LarB, partial [Thermomicrobiales bacterium]
TPDPFADLAAALNAMSDAEPDARLRLDPDRAARTGIPEFVLAERKSAEDVIASLSRLAERRGRALASRVRPDQFAPLVDAIAAPFTLELHVEARIAIVVHDNTPRPSSGGRIAVVAAGTSDRPVATEAAIVAEEMGCVVHRIHDVGVAGLHRLVAPLRAVIAEGVDAIVVAAGMDGALPSVIAGLVPVPVIGLPVSVGYGYGGDGTGALMSMLQACAPGIAVVNIDNGVGAGSMAALIANRAAANRD